MKFKSRLYAALFAALFSVPLCAKEVDIGWCTLDIPEVVWGGEAYQIKLTQKRDVPAGCNISIHIHHVKLDGKWGGLYEMRPAQAPKGVGETMVFDFKARESADCAELRPVVFVAPHGDFNRQVR